MKQLTCEMCGSNDLLKQDGVFVCQTCGTKYSVEEAKKMMVEGTVEVKGTVKIDTSNSLTNYLEMAESAYNSKNKVEAEMYANKVIEIDPVNYKAWLIKGQAAGWQSTLANLRFGECITAFANALNNAPEDEKNNVQNIIGEEINSLSRSLISLRADRFVKWPDEEETAGFQADLTVIIQTLISLRSKNVFVPISDTLTSLAKIINDSVIKAYSKKVYPDYTSQEYPYPNDNDFTQYINRIDNCIAVLSKAIALYSESHEATIQIYQNMIELQNKAIEACSYDWEYGRNLSDPAYAKIYRDKGFIVDVGKGRVYCVSKRLSDSAKSYRRKCIAEYQASMSKINSDIEKREKAKNKELRDAFWKNNEAEHKILTDERTKAKRKLTSLKKDDKGHVQIQLLEKHIRDIEEILDSDRKPKSRLSKKEKDFINQCDSFWTTLSSQSEYDSYLDQHPILKKANEYTNKRFDLIAQKEEIDKRQAGYKKGMLFKTLCILSIVFAVVGVVIPAVVDEDLLFLGVAMGVIGVLAALATGCSVDSEFTSAQGVEKTKAMERKYQSELSSYNKTIDEMNTVPKFTGTVDSHRIVRIPPKLSTDPTATNTNDEIRELVITGKREIQEFAFKNSKSLETVIIEDDVAIIKRGAFLGCESLKTVIMSKNVQIIEAEAFKGCKSLISIEVPDGVKSIETSVFEGCSSLRKVAIGKDVTIIKKNAFKNCRSLVNITIPRLVSEIEDDAFDECNALVEVYNKSNLKIKTYHDDPDSKERYGDLYWSAKQILKDETGSRLRYEGDFVFYEDDEIVESDIEDDDELDEDDDIVESDVEDDDVDDEIEKNIHLINYWGENADVVLPETFQGKAYDIDDGAFRGNGRITSVILPDHITKLPYHAFDGCSSLQKINLTSVKSISPMGFEKCKALKQIVIPKTLHTIDYFTFRGCSSLTIYCEADFKPDGWHNDWNPDNRPVVWGYQSKEQ